MKTRIRFTIAILMFALLTVQSCKKEDKLEFANILELSISVENTEINIGTPDIMTLTIGNTSNDHVVVSESSFKLILTSEFNNDEEFFYLDIFKDDYSSNWIPQVKMEFEGHKTLTKKFDLEKILWKSINQDENILTDGEYSAQLIIDIRLDPRSKFIDEKIESNSIGIRINNIINQK